MIRDHHPHCAELKHSLEEILREVAGPARKRFPSRFSPSIWAKLSGQSVQQGLVGPESVNYSIRQIHDYYGWMAKHGIRGVCAGTLYRSVNFMKLAPSDRNGTKNTGRNVHIEHTVPVSVLERALEHCVSDFQAPSDLHWFLISHSICVAFTAEEEQGLREAGIPASINDAFNACGKRVHPFPFRRYRRLANQKGFDFRIVNVVSGEEIHLDEFSFDDHVKALRAASLLVNKDDAWLYKLDAFEDRFRDG